jgi:hypothetical protein
MHTHSPNKPKKFKQTSACQKADGNCFLGQERNVDGKIHAIRDHNNVRSVCESLKNCVGPLKTDIQCIRNAPPWQCASAYNCRTRVLLEHVNWGLFDHPP